MKKITFIVSLLLLTIVTSRAHSPEDNLNSGEGIQFQSGIWTETLELAKKENKLIFLDLYASWCGPCKLLKSRTFPNEEVGAFYNANFINYAIDAEKGEGVKLASLYKITGYPTLLFIDGDGRLIAKTMGYYKPDAFLEIGQQVLKIK